MIERAEKTGNLITWLRSLLAGRRQEKDRYAFFQVRSAFRRAAREENHARFIELWCGVKVEK